MALDPLSIGLSIVQGGLGAFQATGADKRQRNLRKQLRPYQTPDEVYKMYQAAMSRAASGMDPATMDYLTNENDRQFQSTLSTARLLGADPNSLGAAFDQSVNNIMKIGAQNHAINLENFTRYLGALDVVAANKAAEQKSRNDIIKDQLQSAAMDKAAGIQNVGNAINSAIGSIAAGETEELYKAPGSKGQWKAMSKSQKKKVVKTVSGIRLGDY